ncbi:DUF11 domain-containing protein, partial [Leucobacter luti]|nr:DUF11 domain-containing protein [Leucobacter luti]
MLIAVPSVASAETTVADLAPFDATQAERYVEVAQFGTDVAGADQARTGYDVKLDGSTVVFTQERGSRTAGSGSVVVRSWTGPDLGEFSNTTLATPADAKGFGYSVDIDEAAGVIAVGARYSQEVYVYTRSGDEWTTTPTKITPADSTRVAKVASFGEAVSVSGTHIVVGAPNSRVDDQVNAGAAFVAAMADAVAADVQAAPILLSENQVHADDVYGQIVTARGPTAVVSAPQHAELAADGKPYQVGQISSWDLDAGALTFTTAADVNQAQVAFPAIADGGSWAGLGRAATITEDGRILAGAPSEVLYEGSAPGDIATATDTTQGAVYVYNADGSLAGKTASERPHQYSFGASLDLNETTNELFVGSLNQDNTPNTGLVQLYELQGPASTTPLKPLATKDGGESKFGTFGILGGSVQAGSSVDAAGTTHHRAVVSSSGNVYVFESPNAVTLTKTTSLAPGNASPSAVDGRNVADYTVTVQNTTGMPLTDFTVTDDLSNVLDDAEISKVSASRGEANLAGSQLTWTGDLAVDETITITYRATVNAAVDADDEDVQDFTEPIAALVNSVTTTQERDGVAEGVPSVRDAADAGNRDAWTTGVTVTTPIDGALKLAKSAADADGNGHAAPGEVVSYTITATNVGGLTIADAAVQDDLSGVLAYAGAPENIRVALVDRDGGDLSAPDATFTEPLLSWQGEVPAGAVLTITYDVTTKSADELYPLDGGEALVNSVESPHNVDPEGPGTSTPVEDELTLAKTATPNSGTEVKPGDEIVYTLTLTNKDQTADKAGVTVTDDLSGVLPYATLQGEPSAGATVTDSILSWTGDVPAGETVTITYTVQVRDDAPNGQVIGNHASSADVREDPPGTEHEVDNPRGTVELSKSADPASGTAVRPGDTVTYSVTATNDAATDMVNVTVEDTVSGPATVVLSSLPSGAELDGQTIRWTGTVPANDSVVLSYQVTVNADATAPAVIGNVVTSPDMSNDPEDPPATTHPVRTIVLDKTADPATGSTVMSGDVITYTVTATNPSAVDFTDVTVSDSLRDIIANGTLTGSISGGAVYDPLAQSISWTGDIAAGESVVISYQVRVNDVITPEGAVLRNVVSSPDSPTSPETEHPTDNPRGAVTLAKSADPASGSTVRPGDEVTYTVTVTNDTPR